ncbi:pirin family protein [Cytophagaceae bacterium ABcell3]|nr:pirin family protein [Cytophagaceae bacterium ABcell3]
MKVKKGLTVSSFLIISFLLMGYVVENPYKAQDGKKRTVSKVVKASSSKIGFITMKQPLPTRGIDQIDPFLLLHHHGPHEVQPNNPGLPFGPHPHRGFETVTFIFKGDVKHKDSNGFESVIKSGGVQWMTAGKGIVHSERSSEAFKRDGGPLELIQVWVNLPAKMKMSEPSYQGLQKKDIPSIVSKDGKTTINLVSGSWGDKTVPQRGLHPIDFVSVEMKEGGVLKREVDREKNILFYIQEGSLEVNGTKASAHQMVVFENDGELLEVAATSDCRFILGASKPIGEPVASQGPFVMNSEEELKQAIVDYHEGKMGVLEE